MMAAEAGMPLAWTFYIAVEDTDALVAKAAELGAKVIVPPTDIPDTGRFSILIDPQGAALAVLQPLTGGSGGAFDQKNLAMATGTIWPTWMHRRRRDFKERCLAGR